MTNASGSATAQQFIDRFTRASADDDHALLGGCFADVFLAGGADGVRPVPRDLFLAAVPQRRKAFADAGVGQSSLTSYTASELDDHYVLIRTEWTAPRLSGGDPVELSSSFLLYRSTGPGIAVAYLNHRGL
jgi:hypothetical protein